MLVSSHCLYKMQKCTNQLRSLSTNYISESRCWHYSSFWKVWPGCWFLHNAHQ